MDKLLDQILKYLDTEKWYVSYGSVCEKFEIPEPDRKYVLTKLDTDGYVDISRTKTSLSIKISDFGRVFIHETGYKKEKELENQAINSIQKDKRIELFFKVTTLLLAITTAFLGYQSVHKETEIKNKTDRIENLEKQLSRVDNTLEETYFFSSKKSKDVFSLHMTGNDILTSVIDFNIVTSTGDTIFNHRFKSEDLIGYGLIDIENPTDKQRQDFILKRFYTFLDESNFQTPAIAKEEKLDDEFFDEKYFEIIKNQSDCVSFYYLLGEEYMRRITYIKSENKVVEFWSCC
ncbi:hypothetical protein [Maribellus maritimus]|uniref:hypothetical protein n=1 Tax=Maribellus maritimus TaxID=2870838 RepID=UPI001EE9C11F|nr:hypothetical protein [Maribellus maritimus]MCG6191503.1 hypothetical protein [Maribellus maritimus]